VNQQPLDPTAVPATPGEQPPRRLLDRPPSERLASSGAAGTATGSASAVTGWAGAESAAAGAGSAAGSAARATALGILAAAIGAAVHLAVATLLLWTGALLVVAVTVGIMVGLAVAFGAGTTMTPTARRALAVALALAGLAVAVGANWALSGMYLGPLDYLAQVYGLLVPLQAALAALGALAGSR
jgi:hypothetical protein